MRFQKAEDVIAIIEQRKNRGYGLDHFKQYMASLGNPQNRLRSNHIAGTNGKGSTTNDIRSILQAAGYKVGSFTSPFMITHLDRIRINNQGGSVSWNHQSVLRQLDGMGPQYV